MKCPAKFRIGSQIYIWKKSIRSCCSLLSIGTCQDMEYRVEGNTHYVKCINIVPVNLEALKIQNSLMLRAIGKPRRIKNEDQ